jgi:PAS domain S-box-containing protein
MNIETVNFENIIDYFDLYVFTKDLNGCYTYVNQKVCELFGHAMEDIIGKDDSHFFSLDISNDLRVNDQLVMLEGKVVIDEEKNIIAKTGETRFYRSEKKPLKDSEGNIIGLVGFSRDVTERQLLKEELWESKGRFQVIFNQAPLGIAVIDSLTGEIYEANPAFERIAGRSVDELKELDCMTITHPEDIQEDLDRMTEMNQGKSSGFSMEKRYIQPNGHINWINMTVAPMHVKDKRKPRHLCMIEDINARK